MITLATPETLDRLRDEAKARHRTEPDFDKGVAGATAILKLIKHGLANEDDAWGVLRTVLQHRPVNDNEVERGFVDALVRAALAPPVVQFIRGAE